MSQQSCVTDTTLCWTVLHVCCTLLRQLLWCDYNTCVKVCTHNTYMSGLYCYWAFQDNSFNIKHSSEYFCVFVVLSWQYHNINTDQLSNNKLTNGMCLLWMFALYTSSFILWSILPGKLYLGVIYTPWNNLRWWLSVVLVAVLTKSLQLATSIRAHHYTSNNHCLTS